MSKFSTSCHFPSKMWCDISVTRPMCSLGAGVFTFVVQLLHSLILVTESSNLAPHGKELSEDLKRRIVALHEDGQGYKKIANTQKLSCSTVAKIIQRFKWAGSTQNRPLVGRPKKLSSRAGHRIQMHSLKDRRRSAVSIVVEIGEVGGQPVSSQTIRHTLHQIGVHGCHPRRKPLLKTIHKKARKNFVEDMLTKHRDYWNHVLWSDEMKVNLIGFDGFKHDNDHKHTAKTTTALLKRPKVKVIDWPSMCPNLSPIEHLWGILKRKVDVRKVSNIC